MKAVWSLLVLLPLLSGCCGCGLPPGLSLNVFRQTDPAVLETVVDVGGLAHFQWSTTSSNVALNRTGEVRSGQIIPHFSGDFWVEPDPGLSTLTFLQPSGDLQVQNQGQPALQVALAAQDWSVERLQDHYRMQAFVSLEGPLEGQQAQTLVHILESGPSNQALLRFTLKTTLPAGTHLRMQLQEVRAIFRN